MVSARLVRASDALAELDPVFAGLVATFGPCDLQRRTPVDGRFPGLVRAIVFQQLAGRAATAIFHRFVAAIGGELTASAVLATPMPVLRGAGLSGAKAASIVDLATKVVDGTVDLDGIGRVSDAEVVAQLTAVRGIGPWTAEMFLIFNLHRLDVWPVGDLGGRKGDAVAHGLPGLPTPKELSALGERLRPYRSLAAWYCWRAAETVTPV